MRALLMLVLLSSCNLSRTAPDAAVEADSFRCPPPPQCWCPVYDFAAPAPVDMTTCGGTVIGYCEPPLICGRAYTNPSLLECCAMPGAACGPGAGCCAGAVCASGHCL